MDTTPTSQPLINTITALIVMGLIVLIGAVVTFCVRNSCKRDQYDSLVETV